MSQEKYTYISSGRVWGGTHGDEQGLGPGLVELLNDERIDGVSADIANPEAYRQNRRFIDANLSFCIAHPSLSDPQPYEASLVPGIMSTSEAVDLVLDMHEQLVVVDGTPTNYAIVGRSVRPYVLGVIALAGITDIYIGESGLQSRLSNTVLFDIATNTEQHEPRYWHTLLSTVMKAGLSHPPLESFNFYLTDDLITEQELALVGAVDVVMPHTPLPAVAEYFNTDRQIYALCGARGENLHKGLEVYSELDHAEIKWRDGLLRFPSPRAKANVV